MKQPKRTERKSDIDFNGITLKVLKGQVSESNIDVIRKYDKKKSIRNSSGTRRNQMMFLLQYAREMKKPFTEMVEEDIINFLTKKELKQSTKNWYIEILREFFTSIGKANIMGDLTQKPVGTPIRSKDLISPEEIRLLLATADHPRDKALIALMFDLSLERKALYNLNTGDIDINGNAVVVNVKGKRRGTIENVEMECVLSAGEMIQWYNCHKFRNDPKAPFFYSFSPNSKGQRCSYNWPYALLKDLAKQCGIRKRITPHLIRHSSLTYQYKMGLTGVEFQTHARWSSLQMMPRYVNLSAEEVAQKRRNILKGTPIEPEELKPSVMLNLECGRCHTVNPSTQEYCQKCWFPLTRKVVNEEIELIEMLRSRWYSDISRMAIEKGIPFEKVEPKALAKVYMELTTQATMNPEEKRRYIINQIQRLL